MTHAEAGRRIFERLDKLDFVPRYMGFGNPEQGSTATFTLLSGARHVTWYRLRGPRQWRDNCTFPLLTYARAALGFALEATGRNSDWKYTPPALSAHGKTWAPIPPALLAAPSEDDEPVMASAAAGGTRPEA
jgi:FADH2 O2-dependent halogenase